LPSDQEIAAVDSALDRLRTPTTIEDRLEVLRQLVVFWHGPIGPDDGMSESELAGIPMPLPLRWWYRWAGKRAEVMTGQNILFKPRDDKHKYWELEIEDGRLLFYVENQGVYHWSTLPDGDDPPVFGRYASTDPWEKEEITLSEHLILACLFEAVICHAEYRASAAWIEDAKFAEIAKHMQPVATAPWRWLNLRFFARRGAFMCAGKNGDGGYSVSLGAKTEHSLQFLKRYVNDDWEYVAL
jgi:hypothetical protein